ncbi:MAG: hypothetical protein L6R40_008788 [Gallowayella cf. fulva]|nr:MAG: hypothetical protein L6R40_008788 [Xanthomendoza cf. fulva]
MSTGLADSVQGVFHITSYLEDDASTWWRLYCQRVERGEAPGLYNWWALRLVLLEQFSEINRLTTVRDEFANVRQTTSVASYISKFQSIVIELPEKSEGDQIHQFLRGLKKDVQVHTRTHQPQTLMHAMRVADEADRAVYASGSGVKVVPAKGNYRGGGSGRNGPSPMQVGAVSLSLADKARAISEGLCFKCMKSGHNSRECRSGTGKGGKRAEGVSGQPSRPKVSPLASNGTKEQSPTAGLACMRKVVGKSGPTAGKSGPTAGTLDPAKAFTPDVTGQPRDAAVQKDADANVVKPQQDVKEGSGPVRVKIPAYFSGPLANKFAVLASHSGEPEEAEDQRTTNVEANATSRLYERKTPKKRGRKPKPVEQQEVPTLRTRKTTYQRPSSSKEKTTRKTQDKENSSGPGLNG